MRRTRVLQRAYALPLCLMLSGVLAGVFAVYMTRLKSAVSTTTLSIGRLQVFYAADAVARAATEVAAAKLSTMPPSTRRRRQRSRRHFSRTRQTSCSRNSTASRRYSRPRGTRCTA